MTPFRYCIALGGAALAIASAVAAFNYAVDPYLLFNVRRTPGFNDLKPSAATRERMMKAYQVESVDARTIIIGSSRADLGLNPATPAWPAAAQPVYNLGLVGTPLGDSLKYVRHYVASHAGRAPATLIAGLDFEDFLRLPAVPGQASGPRPPNEMEQRLTVGPDGGPNPARPLRVARDRAQGLLSLDALMDSMQTVANNRLTPLANLEANGHLSEASMRDAARADGFALLFDQKNLNTVRQYAQPRRHLANRSDGTVGFDDVAELLAFAKRHGIRVVLTIQPSHVSRLELLDQMGYWSDYERWKRALAQQTAQAAAGQAVTLWDFSGYEAPMQETVPAKGKGDMQWFWDPVHYSARLGDRIVARVFGTTNADDFGVLLTPQNFESRIARVRQDRDAFHAAMPHEVARLARLVCGRDDCKAPQTVLATAR
jgi:hypothetical protein